MKYNISTIISNCKNLVDIQRFLTLNLEDMDLSECISSEEIIDLIFEKIKLSPTLLEEFSSKLNEITNSWHDFCLSLGGFSATTTEFFNPLFGEDHANLYLYIDTKKFLLDDGSIDHQQLMDHYLSIVNWYRQFAQFWAGEYPRFDIEIFKISSDDVGICFNIFGCFDILKFIAH